MTSACRIRRRSLSSAFARRFCCRVHGSAPGTARRRRRRGCNCATQRSRQPACSQRRISSPGRRSGADPAVPCAEVPGLDRLAVIQSTNDSYVPERVAPAARRGYADTASLHGRSKRPRIQRRARQADAGPRRRIALDRAGSACVVTRRRPHPCADAASSITTHERRAPLSDSQPSPASPCACS